MNDINELFAQYPGIAAKAAQMGKIKVNMINKKNFAHSIEQWNRFTPEELAKFESEIAGAEIIGKSMVYTPTAICYTSIGCLHVIPVREIVWIFPYVIKESMNFIPTGKEHQLRLLEKNGEQHLLCQLRTNGFSKKTPAVEVLEQMKTVFDTVRPGIFYGYSKELEQFCNTNLPAAAAQVDGASQNAQ